MLRKFNKSLELILYNSSVAIRFFSQFQLPVPDCLSINNEGFDMKGRNSRIPKKANHGARPCSSFMRKLKKSGYYKRP